MRFTAELRSTGGNTTGFVVPEQVVEGLGGGRRPKVTVTLGVHTWRSSIASMGGVMMLGVSAANRQAAEVQAGQTYDVVVVLDEAPRTVELPPELSAALEGQPAARAAWDRLSPSHQRAHADAVAGAKQEETRQRRIAKVIAALDPTAPQR